MQRRKQPKAVRRHSLQTIRTVVINQPQVFINHIYGRPRGSEQYRLRYRSQKHGADHPKSVSLSKRMQPERIYCPGPGQKEMQRRRKCQTKAQRRFQTLQQGRQRLGLNSRVKTLEPGRLVDQRHLRRQLEDWQLQGAKIQVDWKTIRFPLRPDEVVQRFESFLTTYEKVEIMQYRQVFYFGQLCEKVERSKEGPSLFDDQDNHLVVQPHNHLAYRFEILGRIGKGAFGQVVRAFDHKSKSQVAVKIVRNKRKLLQQSFVQVRILKHIKKVDPKGVSNLLRVNDSTVFRDHMLIVTQLLGLSLYQFIERGRFCSTEHELVRKLAIQVLQGLLLLSASGIVHCDIKPENLVFREEGKSGIRIIDFGSGCFKSEKIYSYIQSRYYRAPEVILGYDYGCPIDIWSLGCVLAELSIGLPIFPGESQAQQILLHVELLGRPPLKFLQKCSRAHLYFARGTNQLLPEFKADPGSKQVGQVLGCGDQDMIRLVQGCLRWDPEQRLQPHQALLSEYILKGLPADIRKEHIAEMKSPNPYGLCPFNPYEA